MAPTQVLLDETSPYRSRRVIVEYDTRTTAAYLLDPRGQVRVPVWLANHEIAPETSDASGLYEGRAPLMPAAHTKHPQGRAPFDPATLRAVWFEEATA